ncbi:MAG: hypothetical protein K8S23_14660 [Candidatus Cloacimonetes bacterium]|nr:hypothetical protein [Candidatus Cloacimonadota bacterium]
MKILVLGGTLFLGRYIVENALSKGHEITLFNRGISNSQLFPEIEKLKGDRDSDLQILKNRKWDLADFIIKSIEMNKTGIFNATGPKERFTFQELIDLCVPFAKKKVEFIKISEKYLEDNLFENKVDLPLLEAKGEWKGIEQVDCSKGIKNGLVFRDLKSTINDTLLWFNNLPKDYELKTGLKPEIEKLIIQNWREESKKEFSN